jgi:hypothetical protein
LFGEEETTRSLLPEKAEISDYVRKQLATEKKLFGAVSSQAAAERLGEAGSVIKAGENAETAQRANQGILLYDKLSSTAGPIDGSSTAPPSNSPTEKTPMTPNGRPIEPSATPSPSRSVNSPEFLKEACADLKDMVAKGHVKLAPGNTIEP